VSTTSEGLSSAEPSESGLFARQATGLVRGVSPRSSFIINFIPGHPSQSLAVGFFIAFALFPGGSYLLALAMVIPLALAMSYAFGLLTQMIPRSGGDYVLVSRVLHPALGLVSSFCMTLSSVLSCAFFGIAFVTIGLGPGLIGIGLVAGSDTLLDWGSTIQGSRTWQFFLGAGMMVLAGLIMSAGWRSTLRIQNVMFWLVTASLGLCVIVALFTSNGAFADNFNEFAQPYTNNPDTYNSVISAATEGGIDVDPSFSFANTIPIVGLFATFAIFSYWSTNVGGELRQASSMKTANNMAFAGLASLAIVLVCSAIFLRTFGNDFMIAANGAGLPEELGTAPTFFFLMAASVGNSIYAVIVTVCYILFWPLICYIAFLQPARVIFAYAFDGILPKGLTKVSRRGAPYVAVIVTVVASILALLWAIRASSFFQVLVYATLIQLVAMALVGLAAIVVPWRRPELYRASTSQRTLLGMPAVSVAGAGAVATCVFIWVLYLTHRTEFGLTDLGRMAAILGGTIVLAAIFYVGVLAFRRSQGVDLTRTYAEIPPE
jgi:amino acid transporter